MLITSRPYLLFLFKVLRVPEGLFGPIFRKVHETCAWTLSKRIWRNPGFKKLITQALGYLGHIGIGHPHILTPLLIVFLPESDRVIFISTSKCLVCVQKHLSTFGTSYQNVIFSKASFYPTRGSSGFSWALWFFYGLSLS